VQVVTPETPLRHVRDRGRGDTAACGEPAKQENIVDWGGDHNCETCAAVYAQRAWRQTA
jgi:hypothetical protein